MSIIYLFTHIYSSIHFFIWIHIWYVYISIYETHVGEETGWWFLIYSFNTLQQKILNTIQRYHMRYSVYVHCVYILGEFDHISSSSKISVWRPSGNQLLWWHVTPPHFTQIELYTDLERCHINEQNGRCVRKGWVKGIEVTIAHTRSGGAPEPKLEKDLWLRGIPWSESGTSLASTWSSSRFPCVSAVAPDPNFEGVMKKCLPTQKNTETDLLFFSEKIHRPIFFFTISRYICLVYPISWI